MQLECACYSHKGKVRIRNEDNFWFFVQYLKDNRIPKGYTTVSPLDRAVYLGVYDGMGGENFGDVASLVASEATTELLRREGLPKQNGREFLKRLCEKTNLAVVDSAREHFTERMGSTLVSLLFLNGEVHACNLGDSRSYLLRGGVLEQLSVDHNDGSNRILSNGKVRKAALTQHLGIDPEYMILEPEINSRSYRAGDRYLICSDGVTDMLQEDEIRKILLLSADSREAVRRLFEASMEAGGKDNITAIVGRVIE